MSQSLFQITDIRGFSPQIGRLVSMMNYARHTTLKTVDGLSAEQLDQRFDENSNSIGALLLHMAAVEVYYFGKTFENREFTAAEEKAWGAAIELGERVSELPTGLPLFFYQTELGAVRERTLAEFKRRDDAWLATEQPFWNDQPANNYFMCFHVFEDEINHRGQMRWFRKRLK